MQMKTRDEYGKQLRNEFFDSNSQNREQTVRVVFHQIRESAMPSVPMVKIRMMSGAGPGYQSGLKLTDWPVY